jgi:MoxR-like ATPase
MSTRDDVLALQQRMGKSIVGQQRMVERLLLGLLADGHLLVEGLPGLAKTRAIKMLARNLDARLSRIQFTPDLLPADITGSEIYFTEGGKGEFRFQAGPVFANLVHISVDYPEADAEADIVRLARMEETGGAAAGGTAPVRLAPEAIFTARAEIHGIHVSEAVERYIVALVQATRAPKPVDDDLDQWIQVGVSPRGSIGLDKVARAHAWLRGRDFVTPEDVQAVVGDVFRHRLILSYQAHAAGIGADAVIERLVQQVAVA